MRWAFFWRSSMRKIEGSEFWVGLYLGRGLRKCQVSGLGVYVQGILVVFCGERHVKPSICQMMLNLIAEHLRGFKMAAGIVDY